MLQQFEVIGPRVHLPQELVNSSLPTDLRAAEGGQLKYAKDMPPIEYTGGGTITEALSSDTRYKVHFIDLSTRASDASLLLPPEQGVQ